MHVRRLIFMLVGFIAIVAAIAGCAYAKKEIVAVSCTIPATVSYAANITPIISANCYSCHSSSSNSSGILLDNYNALKAYAQNGYLYGTISHASGYRPMPDNGGKLSDCNIAIIKAWIDSGTPQ
jgi:uncharacterized membrane protein